MQKHFFAKRTYSRFGQFEESKREKRKKEIVFHYFLQNSGASRKAKAEQSRV